MNASAFFAAATKLPVSTLAEVTRGRGLVVVAPHPDDESLGCGGLIAAASAEAILVRVIVVSDGVGSHPKSKLYPPSKLRALREAETLAATAELGLNPAAVSFLRLPDRDIPTGGVGAEAARNAIVEAAKEIDAGAVCVTWRYDPHCDHMASAIIVDAAAERLEGTRLLSYPIWGWELSPDAEVGAPPIGLRFDATRHLAAKAAAIFSHRSQTTDLIDDDPEGFRLTPEMIARFTCPYEIYLY